MFEQRIGWLPERWRELSDLFVAPIVWISRAQSLLIDFFVDTSSGWTATAKYTLLAFPALLGLTAVWCTQLSLYTLPLRSRRMSFISTLLMTWWGAALAVWMYWIGLVRLVVVLLAVVTLAVKLTFEAARRLVFRPLSAATRNGFRPGVPGVAVALLVSWCALEATVFTYTVLPTLAEALPDLVGHDRLPRVAPVLVWLFLFLLALGSFVCIQVLVEAVKTRALPSIVLSALVGLFVMYFEVVFLYRDFAEIITPWIVQETGDAFEPGAWFTVSVARFGWTGVRMMGWFLFGQYGTPPLLRLLSRRLAAREEDPVPSATPGPAGSSAAAEDVTGHLGWLQDEGHKLLEYLGLPVLHLIAAALNFVMVLVAAQPIFALPFKGLTEALEGGNLGDVPRAPREGGRPG